MYELLLKLKLIKKIKDDEIQKKYEKIFDATKKGSSVEINEISKIYENGIRAVDKAQINIQENEFICLLGPSGCGKTTILRMIAGLEKISSGLLKFNKTIVNTVEPNNRELAMVFQNYALYPFMSVKNNIAFGLKLKTKKTGAFINKKEEISQLKNILKYKKKLLKHELFMLQNTGDEELMAINTALKIKKRAKRIDEEYRELLKRQELILKKAEENNNKNAKRVEILKLALSKYKNEWLSEELAKLDIEGATDKQKEEMLSKSKKKYIENQEKAKKELKINKNELKEIVHVWRQSIPYRINEITSLLGINDYLNRKPSELSGGQRQRVALARAIAKNTTLFLYDEPLSNLDAKLRTVMRYEIRNLHDKLGATSIYVTHDQIEAMTMADKIVVMNAGYIQQIGSPQEIYDYPANIFVATFVGSPEMNIIEAKTNEEKGISFPKSKIKLKYSNNKNTPKKNKKVFLGIRPNDIITHEDLFSSCPGNVIKGKVIIAHSTGKESIVLLDTPIGKINAIFSVYNTPQRGTEVEVMISPSRIHLFDQKTGMTLLPEMNKETIAASKVWQNGSTERIANSVIISKEKEKDPSIVKLIKLIKRNSSSERRQKYKEYKAQKELNIKTDKTLVERYLDEKK